MTYFLQFFCFVREHFFALYVNSARVTPRWRIVLYLVRYIIRRVSRDMPISSPPKRWIQNNQNLTTANMSATHSFRTGNTIIVIFFDNFSLLYGRFNTIASRTLKTSAPTSFGVLSRIITVRHLNFRPSNSLAPKTDGVHGWLSHIVFRPDTKT